MGEFWSPGAEIWLFKKKKYGPFHWSFSSTYIRVKKSTRTNIRIYSYDKFDTNICPNKYLCWKLCEYSNIFEYSFSFYTLTHSRTIIQIYSYNQIWRQLMSEYICIEKIDMNKCPNKYLWQIYSNIQTVFTL